MAAAMFSSARRKSVTWDEAGHIAHGYGYLATGNFWFDQAHPALPRLLAGLPLKAVEPRVPTEHHSWRNFEFVDYRELFLFRNRVDADTIVLLSRISTMLCTLLLGLALALWCKRQFGTLSAAIALALFAFDPNILAFGHYATTEIFTAATLFATVIAWGAYLESRKLRFLAATGLFAGLALATKTSMVYILGLLPLLALVYWRLHRRKAGLGRMAVSFVIVVVLAAVVIGAVYWPETRVQMKYGAQPLAEHVSPDTDTGAKFHWLATTFDLPMHPYLMTYYWIGLRNEQGAPGYFLGEVSNAGWWYYYPAALLVKGTTAFLAGLFIAAGAVAGLLARRSLLPALRSAPFAWYLVTIPPAIYFGFALTANIASGSRLLLPIYPFLFAFIGGVLGHALESPRLLRIRNAAIATLAVLLVVESALAHPHYLAFFNLPSGGSRHGHHYLVDSSLDWGQDLKGLAAYVQAEGVEEVCLAYFGMDNPEYRQIPYRYLNPSDNPEELDCLAAVSVNYLQGFRLPGEAYSWFEDREPDHRIGHSIYLYDLRKRN